MRCGRRRESNSCSRGQRELHREALVVRSVETDAGIALVRGNRVEQVGGASIVQEEEPLAQSPKRRGAEHVRPRSALGNSIRQGRSHVVQAKVGKRLEKPVAQAADVGGLRSKALRVTQITSYFVENLAAILRGSAQSIANRSSC